MFKRNIDKDTVKDFEGGGGSFLNRSGMYQDVILKRLIYDEAENGGAVVNLFVEYKGEEQVVYGDIRVYNKGGADNKIGQEQINELLIILDIEDLGEPEEEDLPIGKKKAIKTVAVFPAIDDEPISIRILNKYSVWNNNIGEKTTVAKFYQADTNATAYELLQQDEEDAIVLGTKFGKDLEFAGNVKYEDGLTEGQVGSWIKAKRPKGTAGATTSSGTSRKPSFKKPVKKFGR